MKTLLLLLFAASIFVSAFLLFQVQPIMAKFILPWFGGGTGIWTTCMVVFQLLLFAGYAYAHYLNRWLSTRVQIHLHVLLLILAVCTLPITPSPEWKPVGSESPTMRIIGLLFTKVGAAYFMLSATGPLLQSWLSKSNAIANPHRLYALSNVGSLLALISYPILVEPILSSSQQSTIWSGGFVLFSVLCSLSGITVLQSRSPATSPTAQRMQQELIESMTRQVERSTVGIWFGLSFLSSMLLLATTNQVCLDIGVVPFLWIIPLSLYLLSFILTFNSEKYYMRNLSILFAATSFLMTGWFRWSDARPPLWIEFWFYFSALFFSCMVCHGEIVRRRPSPDKLTWMYLTISAGGACGGLFVGIVAPLLFNGYFEWQLGMLACTIVFYEAFFQDRERWTSHLSVSTKWCIAIGVPFTAVFLQSQWQSKLRNEMVAVRNFYGVLSVVRGLEETSGKPIRKLMHGRIIHGSQFQERNLRHEPTTYFTAHSGVGHALLNHKPDAPRNVGIVGLGAGTIAAYGNQGDRFRFYEINPQVIELAVDYFSFLSDSEAKIEMAIGDARLCLEREESQHFDLLILDAFSGDAIPVHLLTREAMTTYLRHLAADGVLAIHISNLYLELEGVIGGLAKMGAFESAVIYTNDDADLSTLSSKWVLLCRSTEQMEKILHETPWIKIKQTPVLWTDDRNNLWKTFKWE